MRIEELRGNLEKRAIGRQLEFELPGPADPAAIDAAEVRIGHKLTRQVRLFYSTHNGLRVSHPALEVYPVERLELRDTGLLVFCQIDDRYELAFDLRSLNDADEWTIVALESGLKVTLTMAHFWSTLVFAWIDRRRAIWE